jgi:hypothetical protein
MLQQAFPVDAIGAQPQLEDPVGSPTAFLTSLTSTLSTFVFIVIFLSVVLLTDCCSQNSQHAEKIVQVTEDNCTY